MTQKIPEGAQYVRKINGNFARWSKDLPQMLEWFHDGRWVRGHLRWTEAELLDMGYTRLSSTAEEQPFTRDNLPADAEWVSREPFALHVAKWDPDLGTIMYRRADQKAWVPAKDADYKTAAALDSAGQWERIKREPQESLTFDPEQHGVKMHKRAEPEPPRPYGIPLSDKEGIKNFVPPPLPEPKAEPKPRVSTLNRAWRWLAG